jgi:hypothetical protein
MDMDMEEMKEFLTRCGHDGLEEKGELQRSSGPPQIQQLQGLKCCHSRVILLVPFFNS